MNTPITKRVHMNAAKKNSIAKQTTPSSGNILVKDKDNNVFKASADIEKGKKVKKQSAGSPEFDKAFAAARKAGKKVFEFKGEKYNTNLAKEQEDTPGSVKFNYDPVLTDPTEGTTVDTSTAYNVRQISRGQKKSARDVRRARIKLSKLGDFDYNPDGSINMESIKPKEGLSKNARKMAKFNESLSELKSMQNTQKRITDMAKAGVDPRRTARFKSGTEMKAGDPGGKQVKDTEGKYQTQEEFENKTKKEAGINLGSTNSEESNTSQGDALSSKLGTMPQGDALKKILRENIDKKAKVNKPVSTAMSNVVSQGYSTSTMFAKKYNKPTSMLKKSCMKMGGFGSKTYKK